MVVRLTVKKMKREKEQAPPGTPMGVWGLLEKTLFKYDI